MNIIWLSANRFGYELLKEVVKLDDIKISSIITLSSNSKTIMYDGIEDKKWYDFGIKVFKIDDINNEKNLIQNLSPYLIVVCGWRQLIREDILRIPEAGFIAFHPTLLPIGRGSAPIINSILQGFKESGLTMFYLSDKIDEGDIIGQVKFKIKKTDHASEVYQKIIDSGKILIKKYLRLIIQNTNPRIPQNDSKATYFKKPGLDINKLDFENESIDKIYNKIRALSKPYNGAYIEKEGKKLIIWRAELLKD